MPSLSNALYIGLSGIRVNQQGLNVAGHNIANVNTEGYTRQQIVLEANKPILLNQFLFGTGVNLKSIARVRDAFLDRQYRDENQLLGDFEKQSESIELVEGILSEPGDTGLHQTIKNFFTSLQDLATNPESSSVRTTVSERGRSMARMFNQMWTQLDKIRNNKNLEIIDQVKKVNEILDRVAELNVQIGSTEALGNQANDFRDNRDRLLDELSRMVDISAVEDPANNTMTVSIAGQSFVVIDKVTHVEARSENIGGRMEIHLYNPEAKVAIELRGGELRGLVEIRDRMIPGIQDQLDTLARALIDEVNAIHRQGYGLQGSRLSLPTGIDFFSGDDAQTIKISSLINNDPGNIAASGGGAPGDNTNALELAMLRNKGVLNNGRFTFEDYLASTVSAFGLQSDTIQQRRANQEILVEHLSNFRESVIGVNLDEELVNLIRYQKAFGANARVISTTNEMMGVLVQLGRY
ncbi:MAG: flagellar hook-associated protein FlgK [Candidatus Glassbacteria bacterium]|nr:flagellar hook-associated protein FlgK [Candidatus Glassbacteria bacterium]